MAPEPSNATDSVRPTAPTSEGEKPPTIEKRPSPPVIAALVSESCACSASKPWSCTRTSWFSNSPTSCVPKSRLVVPSTTSESSEATAWRSTVPEMAMSAFGASTELLVNARLPANAPGTDVSSPIASRFVPPAATCCVPAGAVKPAGGAYA